jgi:hypothetical protein
VVESKAEEQEVLQSEETKTQHETVEDHNPLKELEKAEK